MKQPTISAVVTCHNNFVLTSLCIGSLLKGTIVPDEIILIDNASTDETEKYFSEFKGITYFRRHENDGSIIGRNIGIYAAQSERILVLDNDQIVDTDTIEKYLKHDSDLVGIELRITTDDGIGHKIFEPFDDDRVYLGIGGLMIKKYVIDEIGALDEGFAPAYCDDPDFFWRATEAGYSWAYLEDSGVLHIQHSTLNKTLTIETSETYRASHQRLIDKWPTRFEKLPLKSFPLVSYVIPTYNRKEFLTECIDSIIAQTYKNIEIIVVDDGSTDGTGDFIKSKYPMVKYLYHDNRKIPYTLNRGFREARGEFVCWLSSDDGIFPTKTEDQLRYMLTHPEIDLSFTEYEIRWWGDSSFTGQAGTVQLWRPKEFTDNHVEFMYCLTNEVCNQNGSTSMFRKSAFRAMGYFIETLHLVQDWEMWLRYLNAGTVGHVEKNLGWRNEHKDVSQGYCQGDPDVRARFDKEKECVKKYYRMFTDPNRPTVCVMICAKDEAFEIERCLDDIILWADKIVIFDDGSTDDTVEIARQYPKVVSIHQKGNLGNVRTEGRDRQILYELACKQKPDWIMFLDADEVFEDKLKWQIYDMITASDINLYHFLEINFWRGETHYRIDNSYNLGWFGRLFRCFPRLSMTTDQDEHSGGVPHNIPGATQWGESERGRKSDVCVKHYGFSDYQRVTEKAWRRWQRDPIRTMPNGEKRGGWIYYERMINETGLTTILYNEEL
jgi:glycosyltransferase involved in cell wall biosynthesis